MQDNGRKIRPRLTKEELTFISYALLVLEQSAQHKLREIDYLPLALKRFARIVWFTGDPKAFELWKPYRKYVLCELGKGQDFVTIMLNAKNLRRRLEGLLNGKRFHSQEHWQR